MRMFVAAAREFRVGTAIATWSWPVIAPPLDPAAMVGADLIYLCLHGLDGQSYLYGDRFETALSAEQIRALDMSGTVVYLAGCFGDGPIADAFLAAGARAVVGDKDTTWAGRWWPMGSNRLGRLFVYYVRRGYPVLVAYNRARAEFAATSTDDRDRAILDTVQLKLAGS